MKNTYLTDAYSNYRRYGSGSTLQEILPTEPVPYVAPPKHVPSESLLADVETLKRGESLVIRPVVDINEFQFYLESNMLSLYDILFTSWILGRQVICGSLIYHWYSLNYGTGVANRIIHGHKCTPLDMIPPDHVSSFHFFCAKYLTHFQTLKP